MKNFSPLSLAHTSSQLHSTTRLVNVKFRGRDWFHEARIRVADRVCRRATEHDDPESANHAEARRERLCAERSLPQRLAMEYHAELR